VLRPALLLPYIEAAVAAMRCVNPCETLSAYEAVLFKRLESGAQSGFNWDGMAALRSETLSRLGISSAAFPTDCLFIGVTVTPKSWFGKNAKGVVFNGATVSGKFVGYNFARTHWVCCHFIAAEFINCSFLGEDVTFLNCTATNSFLHSENNYIEMGCTWRRAPDEAAAFCARGLRIMPPL
jgi:hypothetical protein